MERIWLGPGMYLTLTLGLTSLGLMIPAIIVPMGTKRHQFIKRHIIDLPLSLPVQILLEVGGVMWFIEHACYIPWPFDL